MSACAWACGRLCGPGLLRHDRGLWTAGAFPDLMPQVGLSQHRLRKGQVELSSAGFGSLGRREAEGPVGAGSYRPECRPGLWEHLPGRPQPAEVSLCPGILRPDSHAFSQ